MNQEAEFATNVQAGKDLLWFQWKSAQTPNRNFLKAFLQPFVMTFVNYLQLTSYLIPNNKVNWIVTIKAKNKSKWTKTTMKTEGYIANLNHLSTALVWVTTLVLAIHT